MKAIIVLYALIIVVLLAFAIPFAWSCQRPLVAIACAFSCFIGILLGTVATLIFDPRRRDI